MTQINYHRSHEWFKPSQLLELIQLAEAVGFEAGMYSNHIVWLNEDLELGFDRILSRT
jgi:coenzyme F420-dependent glucose-6-phosphate dehydrogenase